MNRTQHLRLWASDWLRRHTPISARVTWVKEDNSAELIEVKGPVHHKLQFGGGMGDGYCYEHQSFDCLNRLTEDEWAAVRYAQEPQQ